MSSTCNGTTRQGRPCTQPVATVGNNCGRCIPPDSAGDGRADAVDPKLDNPPPKWTEEERREIWGGRVRYEFTRFPPNYQALVDAGDTDGRIAWFNEHRPDVIEKAQRVEGAYTNFGNIQGRAENLTHDQRQFMDDLVAEFHQHIVDTEYYEDGEYIDLNNHTQPLTWGVNGMGGEIFGGLATIECNRGGFADPDDIFGLPPWLEADFDYRDQDQGVKFYVRNDYEKAWDQELEDMGETRETYRDRFSDPKTLRAVEHMSNFRSTRIVDPKIKPHRPTGPMSYWGND